MTQLRATPIPVPKLAHQQRFADLVRGHERLRAAQRESLRQAEHLFQSLLQRAFEEGL
jgi:type I restriction enzyme S subunit